MTTTTDPHLDLYAPGMTTDEVDRARSYLADIVGIRDTFDCLNTTTDLPDLIRVGYLLTTAWGAIECLHDPDAGEGARAYLESQVRAWFDLRRDYLVALARCLAVNVPVPDHADGAVHFGQLAPVGHLEFQLDRAA